MIPTTMRGKPLGSLFAHMSDDQLADFEYDLSMRINRYCATGFPVGYWPTRYNQDVRLNRRAYDEFVRRRTGQPTRAAF